MTKRRQPKSERLLHIIRDAVGAVCQGEWDAAAAALASAPQLTARSAECLNLIGVVRQARHDWAGARRYYSKAIRADRHYAPADQNLRRLYELQTFGSTNLPIALADHETVLRIGRLKTTTDEPASKGQISLWIHGNATIDRVKRTWDWTGYAAAIVSVALATAIGWPLVHSALQLSEANVLMLYLLCVLWVATHHSRGAAVLASVLGVAAFDFVFIPPYYTFAVAQREYLVTFAVMLATALVISSLTHRVRVHSELARQAWQRVETEFLRNTLLSGVSHELRTPLAAISGAASTLLHDGRSINPAMQTDLLQSICSESDRMDRLINNLLDMTRLEAGGMIVKKDWLHPQEVIASALQHQEAQLAGRSVKLTLPEFPLVQMDGVLIEQVLTTMLDNVIQYTPAGSEIEVIGRCEPNQIGIAVADRGPGLPPGTEARVFEKFFRIRPDESRRGIGLGLAVVRGIVEAHGGSVSAANRPDGGAVFRFTLPRHGTAPTVRAES
jgi:two-component system sensor histidine kinase KdpD